MGEETIVVALERAKQFRPEQEFPNEKIIVVDRSEYSKDVMVGQNIELKINAKVIDKFNDKVVIGVLNISDEQGVKKEFIPPVPAPSA